MVCRQMFKICINRHLKVLYSVAESVNEAKSLNEDIAYFGERNIDKLTKVGCDCISLLNVPFFDYSAIVRTRGCEHSV